MWGCPSCGFTVILTDDFIKDEVVGIQNNMIATPGLVETEVEEYSVVYSLEAKRLANTVHRMLDAGDYMEDELINMILQCAAENYNSITSARHITDRLTAVLAHAEPLSSFSQELFNKTVRYIRLSSNGEISMELQNNKIVKNGDAL